MNESFLYTHLDRLLKQTVPPKSNPSPEDIETANLLRLFGFIYLCIEKCRKELNLKTPRPYEPGHNKLMLQMMANLPGPNDQFTLDRYALAIVNKYGLSDNWIVPFKVAILTHTLPVPEDPIITINSTFSNGTPNVYKRIFRNGITYNNSVLIEVHRRPATLNELYTEIKKRGKELGGALNQLPARASTKMDKATQTWGRLAYIYRLDHPATNWAKVYDDFQEAAATIKQEDMGFPPLPSTKDDLIKYWQHFEESMIRNFPNQLA